LSLWYNIGGDAGARILMKSLLSNYTLSSLDLRDNRISDAGVAEVVDMLRRNLVLTTLKLQDNELGEEGILALSHALHDNYVLESLEIVDNPASLVAALPHLERISFGVKRNRSFSDQRFGKAFAASNMGLIHVPPQLFSLTTLQALDLSHNRFSTFPDSITVLRSLERLSFAHNSLSQFPSYCCSSFARLHTLDLSHNRLVTFPAESAAMTALRVLHLDSNALETLPASLGRVEWESLRVEGNPLSCVPPSTVAKVRFLKTQGIALFSLF
jgi:Leucine-rich repeat (LRR) protein